MMDTTWIQVATIVVVNVLMVCISCIFSLSKIIKNMEKYQKQDIDCMKIRSEEEIKRIKEDIRRIEQKLDRIRGG